jgi:hypothetical protein
MMVSLYDHVAASVSGARFATTGWISFNKFYIIPQGNTQRFFHFRDLTYFKLEPRIIKFSAFVLLMI